MAEKTFIVKLAGDSKSYQQSMSQASKALDNYQKQNLSTGAAVKSLTSVLTKYVSAAALVKGASEAITRTLKGTNDSADALAGAMHAAKVTVDAFFASISTGDFSAFAMGLNNIVQQAQAAYQALDRLGNASMSWNYFQSAKMADLTDFQSIVNDKDRPMAERMAAYEGIKEIKESMTAYAKGFTQRALEALAKEMTAATNVSWENVSRADLEKVLALDLMDITSSEARKAELDAQYEEYTAKLTALKNDFEKNYRKRERVQTGVTMQGLPIYNVVDRTRPEDTARYEQQVRSLSASYMDAVLYTQLLKNQSDEWLQSLIQIVQQADNAERSLRRINNAELAARNSLNAGGSPAAPVIKTPTGALPELSGLSVPVTATSVPDRLPEVDNNLRTISGTLEGLQGNIDGVSSSMDRMNNTFDGINSAGRALESLGSAFSNLEGSGWKAAGGVLSSAGAVVQAYTQMAQAASIAAAAEAASETPTVWGKIAAITAMLGAFASMVSSVKTSVQAYAEGGIVPGQNYNDGITARVSSGEMVINEADQKRLYDSIHSGAMGGGSVRSSISGEQIVIAVNNYARRTNRGELVFAGRG